VLLAALFPAILVAWTSSLVHLVYAPNVRDGAAVALVVVVLAFPLLIASSIEGVRLARDGQRP
jgi:hypothetical protein